MKIGIIGAGEVALAVARRALSSGHDVVLSNSRGPQTLGEVVRKLGSGASAASMAEAASNGLVLLATPWLSIWDALSSAPPWSGRILIDATNPFTETTPNLVLADLGGRGASEIVAELAPQARVVKAFNSLLMRNFDAGPVSEGARRVIFLSGDDTHAKRLVSDLIASFDFRAVDLGGLVEGGRMQQAGGPLAGQDFLIAN